MRGTTVSFRLGENHQIVFIPHNEWNCQLTICYTKPLENNQIAHYEKEIERK